MTKYRVNLFLNDRFVLSGCGSEAQCKELIEKTLCDMVEVIDFETGITLFTMDVNK